MLLLQEEGVRRPQPLLSLQCYVQQERIHDTRQTCALRHRVVNALCRVGFIV